eukprot:scaffold76623_cov69-Phaeocystis_antarctica.AAC.3
MLNFSPANCAQLERSRGRDLEVSAALPPPKLGSPLGRASRAANRYVTSAHGLRCFQTSGVSGVRAREAVHLQGAGREAAGVGGYAEAARSRCGGAAAADGAPEAGSHRGDVLYSATAGKLSMSAAGAGARQTRLSEWPSAPRRAWMPRTPPTRRPS